MTKLEEWMIKFVTDRQGCKAIELTAEAVSFFPAIDSATIISALGRLVMSGKLVEIEYTLPQLSYRVKSFLLPSGASLYLTKI